MTEAEWLSCADPQPMLDFLRGRASDRKLRLFACACCRLYGGFGQDQALRGSVSLMERHADGLLPADEYPTYNTFTHNTLVCAVASGVREGVDVTAGAGWGAAYRCSGNTRAFDPVAGPLHCDLLRDIFRLPQGPGEFSRSCRTRHVVDLAQAIYADHAFARLPELADALTAAGCGDADVLAHCRGPGPHVRGCWVVDLILGKA